MIWALEPGGADEPGTLWAGTMPGGLFRSRDRGESWDMIRPLWDMPERNKWLGGGADIPGDLRPEEIPQFVLLTFDDAVNGLNEKFFSELFKDRYNPNGCPIKVLQSDKNRLQHFGIFGQ